MRSQRVRGGFGQARPGIRLDARRGEGALLKGEIVEDQEPKETKASRGACEPEQFPARLHGQDAVRSVELGVVMVRDDRQKFLEDGRRIGRVLGELVEEPNALLVLEAREERHEPLEVPGGHAYDRRSRSLLGCAFA